MTPRRKVDNPMFANFFRDGGWGMYPTSICGFLLLAAGFLYLLRPESRYTPLVFCLGFMTIIAGVLGTLTGLITTFRYLQDVTPADQLKIAALGAAESTNNMVLALVLTFLAALPTLGGVVRNLRRPAAAA
jgi:hypothetical protein